MLTSCYKNCAVWILHILLSPHIFTCSSRTFYSLTFVLLIAYMYRWLENGNLWKWHDFKNGFDKCAKMSNFIRLNRRHLSIWIQQHHLKSAKLLPWHPCDRGSCHMRHLSCVLNIYHHYVRSFMTPPLDWNGLQL